MFQRRSILINTVIALFVSQLVFWLVFLNFQQLPPEVPLWYWQTVSTAQLAGKQWVWLFPSLSVGILAVDLVTTALVHRRQPFIVGVVMITSSLSSLFILLATLNLFNRTMGWF